MKSKIFKAIKKNLKTYKNEHIFTGLGATIIAPMQYKSYKRWNKMSNLAKKHGLELGKTPVNKSEFKAFVNIHKELYGIK